MGADYIVLFESIYDGRASLIMPQSIYLISIDF